MIDMRWHVVSSAYETSCGKDRRGALLVHGARRRRTSARTPLSGAHSILREPLRIENERHVAYRRGEGLHGEVHPLLPQPGDCGVKVLDLKRDGRAVIARIPVWHAIEDGKITAMQIDNLLLRPFPEASDEAEKILQ